ncbi:MAG: alpha-amylase family glycosyl hydrolase [Lentimicrobiaceae bacterium]|nr:alpha-amylase family glycosyl hydrolase [Lentimicrobiaceae bacterium]
MKHRICISFLVLLTVFLFNPVLSKKGFSQNNVGQKVSYQQVKHPAWAKNATIYEVNLRQYSVPGTFKAFQTQLPRLKAMGIDILWLMPIHPIGEKNRKGTLGSFYSVKDYYGIDPSYGTMEDFKNLVNKAHELGMHLILDWVANHTSWDNPLITEHPDWYTNDSTGKIVSPFDWSDVADLNYDQPGLRTYMKDAMLWWVKETGIDGFRCDVAGMVPTDFWIDVRTELDKISPVFLLAEAEEPVLQQAFDMTYGWEFHHIMNDIAKGKKSADDIMKYFAKNDSLYQKDAYRMYFTSNHDENSWNGTEYERLGEGVKTFAVLSVTVPGMPLVYTGQELPLKKRLQFFEKDTITWKTVMLNGFYTKLLNLKKSTPALWNGAEGGKFVRIPTNVDKNVFAFVREKDKSKVIVILNLSDKPQTVALKGKDFLGTYNNIYTGKPLTLAADVQLTLKPWMYIVLTK